MGGEAPAPADYIGAAEATAAGNKEMLDLQTAANRPNQYNPFGSSEWTKDQYGNWTNEVKLGDAAQATLDDQFAVQYGRSGAALGMLGQVQQDTARGLDWNALPAAGGGIRGANGMQQGLDYSNAGPMLDAGSGMAAFDAVKPQNAVVGTPGAGQGVQGSVAGAGEGARNAAEQALYARSTARLDPRMEQQRGNLDAQLRNQGLNPGDKAYDRQMANFGMTENDAYSSALNDAIIMGGAEQQRQFGMNLDTGQFGNAAQQQAWGQNQQNTLDQNAAYNQLFNQNLASSQYQNAAQGQLAQQAMANRQQGVGEVNQQGNFLNQALLQGQQMDQNQSAYQNQLRQQGISEQQLARNFTLNQLNALLSGQQVQNPAFQGFQAAGYTGGADLLGAAGMQDQANLAAYSAQQQANQGWLSGAASLAGAGMSFMSDERLKRDVERLPIDAYPGIPLATYKWRNDPDGNVEVGVIAQDVEKVMPQAVRVDAAGWKRVVYDMIRPGFHPRLVEV